MATPDSQIRVFISSTFRDMHAERDHLVTVVFPELRERVERLGLEFFDVDLRWGIPAKDATAKPPTPGSTAGNGLTAWNRTSSACSANASVRTASPAQDLCRRAVCVSITTLTVTSSPMHWSRAGAEPLWEHVVV